jgi:hypothetical protein
MVAPTVAGLHIAPSDVSSLREDDVFFFGDGLKNLAAKVLWLAVDDAKRLGQKLPPRFERKREPVSEDHLMEWVYSDRFELWAEAIDLDPNALESRICTLLDGDE